MVVVVAARRSTLAAVVAALARSLAVDLTHRSGVRATVEVGEAALGPTVVTMTETTVVAAKATRRDAGIGITMMPRGWQGLTSVRARRTPIGITMSEARMMWLRNTVGLQRGLAEMTTCMVKGTTAMIITTPMAITSMAITMPPPSTMRSTGM